MNAEFRFFEEGGYRHGNSDMHAKNFTVFLNIPDYLLTDSRGKIGQKIVGKSKLTFRAEEGMYEVPPNN